VARLDAVTAIPEESDECQHPEEQRVDMSSFGDFNHWICRVCRFDNKATTTTES
jgi:hypothetical protein